MNFSIGELHPNTPHLLADLTELLVLVGYNGKSKIHKNDVESILTAGVVSSDEVDEEESADEIDASQAEKNTRVENQLEDLLIQLNYRSGAMADYYPFELLGEELSLKTQLSEKARVYKLLVACSRLRSFGRVGGIPQRWAKAFTLVSQHALCGLLPAYANVRIFDVGSDDRRNHYGTDLRPALRVLGRDLGVLSINDAMCDSAGASGDAGLDLVGNIDLDDGAATSYSILGQCGAQETNWPKKTLEAYSVRFSNYFQMPFHYPGVMFTPVSYRNSDGQWTDTQAATGIFLADRGRILKLLDLQNIWGGLVQEAWFQSFEQEFATAQPPT